MPAAAGTDTAEVTRARPRHPLRPQGRPPPLRRRAQDEGVAALQPHDHETLHGPVHEEVVDVRLRQCMASGDFPTSTTSTSSANSARTAVGASRSVTTTSASDKSRRARTVNRSGSPGPAHEEDTSRLAAMTAQRATHRRRRRHGWRRAASVPARVAATVDCELHPSAVRAVAALQAADWPASSARTSRPGHVRLLPSPDHRCAGHRCTHGRATPSVSRSGNPAAAPRSAP